MNYNFIAPYYQFVSRLVYGKSLINAQLDAKQFIKKSDVVLIVGGGDGEVLKEFQKLDFQKLYFVDSSEKMIQLAKEKVNDDRIQFLCLDIFNAQFDNDFDVIILPFLLDNFSQKECDIIIKKLISQLKTILIVVDFTENPNFWQRIVLRLMYFFFRIFSKLQVKSIPEIEKTVQKNGLIKIYQSTRFYQFIETKVYQTN